MKDIIVYIAEASLFISVFFLVYKLFLRSATFFGFNRIYLVSGLLLSFMLPAVRFSYDVRVVLPAAQTYVPEGVFPAEVPETSSLDIWAVVLLVYIAGVAFFALQSIIAFRRLYKLVSSGKVVKREKYVIVDNKEITSPFTAFKYIMLNTSDLSETEQNLILKHEITHVVQKHWFDLLCSQCALILQWFNPLMWLYISSLKENHEFLADKAVINAGCSPALYQAVLTNRIFRGPVFSFADSFNYPNHLKRLTMMKKVKSSPSRRLAVLILIPALGLFFWASATPNYIIQDLELTIAAPADNLPMAASSVAMPNLDEMRTVQTVKDSVAVTRNKTESTDIKKSVEQFFAKNDTPLIVSDGKELKDSIKEYGEKGEDEAVEVYKKKKKEKDPQIKLSELPKDKQPLYIVAGKEITDPESIDPNTIDAISIIKDHTGIELYGEKAKNGVIIIELTGRTNEQGIPIKTYIGRVVKEGTDEGIADVAVILESAATGTITDLNGFYTIAIPKNSTLTYSHIGYKKKEQKIEQGMNVITLQEE